MPAFQPGRYDDLLIQARDRMKLVTTPSFLGDCTIRIQVQPGDGGSNATDRDEIARTGTVWRTGDDVWYGLVVMLARTYATPPPGGWVLIYQFFAQDIRAGISGGSPPFAIEITPAGQFRIHVRGGAKANAYDSAPRDDQYNLAAASAGVWHTVLIHIKWSAAEDGLVEVWDRQGNAPFLNHPQVYAPGPNVLTVAGDALPVYAETGIYRSHAATTQTVFFARLTAEPTQSAALQSLGLRSR